MFLVLLEIVIAAMGDALEFLHAEGEFVLEVVGALRVKARSSSGTVRTWIFARGMPMDSYQARRSSSHLSSHSGPVPGLMKNLSSICSNSRERKVKLRGLISLRKALPICAMPKGSFWREVEHVVEVDEDGLRGLGAEIGDGVIVLDGADVGLEHQVEGARPVKLAGLPVIRSWMMRAAVSSFPALRRLFGHDRLRKAVLAKRSGSSARRISFFFFRLVSLQ
ncbi:MAG: hypothetical protein QM805_22480 [Pseudomonas sp.]